MQWYGDFYNITLWIRYYAGNLLVKGTATWKKKFHGQTQLEIQLKQLSDCALLGVLNSKFAIKKRARVETGKMCF